MTNKISTSKALKISWFFFGTKLFFRVFSFATILSFFNPFRTISMWQLPASSFLPFRRPNRSAIFRNSFHLLRRNFTDPFTFWNGMHENVSPNSANQSKLDESSCDLDEHCCFDAPRCWRHVRHELGAKFSRVGISSKQHWQHLFWKSKFRRGLDSIWTWWMFICLFLRRVYG